jgi:cytochrome c oxidase assembly protein subunit 15
LIDGALVPDSARLWFIQPAWRNIFENTLTVQFNHRMLAYAIFAGSLWHAYDAWRSKADARGALWLAGGVTLQATLGIITLLEQAPLGLALSHQMLAVVLLTGATVHAERLSRRDRQVVGHAAVGAV